MCQLLTMLLCHSMGIAHKISDASDSADRLSCVEGTSTSVDEFSDKSAQKGDNKIGIMLLAQLLSLDVSQSCKIWKTDFVGG